MAWAARLEAVLFGAIERPGEWAAVALGAGVGLWFALRFEPGAIHYAAVGLAVLASCVMAIRRADLWRLAGVGVAALGIGFLAAGLRAHLVAAPVVPKPMQAEVEGTVVGLDRSASGRLRLTLADLRIPRLAAEAVPARVRISLREEARPDRSVAGLRVRVRAFLVPPAGPTEPEGFDFRRHAWFWQIGGVGYARDPPEVLGAPQTGAAVLARLRARISEAIRRALPGETGSFAAALAVGDRAWLPEDAVEALRISGLAHLLAISGLHMGLLVGAVFATLRLGLAALPPGRPVIDTRKPAAMAALLAASAYLLLSGAAVASQRAYVMAVVMLVAVLLGRRAVTLRSVAIAAAIILLARPESLLGPGFQMSFAATAALVAVFERIAGRAHGGRGRRWPWPARLLAGTVLASLVAGLATAPFAAAHFGRIAHYGLLANTLAVPAMGVLVAPGLLLAAVLAPFGLDQPGLALAGAGIDHVLRVAHMVAALPRASSRVPAPPGWAFAVLAGALVALILGRRALRGLGLAALGVAFLGWWAAVRPALLVSDSARVIGLMTREGRALSHARRDGFVVRDWLENDGDSASREDAARRGQRQRIDRRLVVLQAVGTPAVAIVTGKGSEALVTRACLEAALVVHDRWRLRRPVPRGCRILDRRELARNGAHAGRVVEGRWLLRSVREVRGSRLWSPPPREP